MHPLCAAQLLARGKLPKNHQDTGPFMSRQIRHYDWTDLAIGRTVNVWGRALFMYDCDEFTRSWFRKHGAPEEALEAVPIDVERKLAVPKQAVAPDWYGIGTERDQMQSVNSLIPKPPKFGWEQFMEHGSSALRFAARLVPEHGCRLLPADDIREFVISYFLADDTIQIYEPPIRNSGIIGGKFLERTAIKKPHAVNQDYRARDLYVGAHLVTLSRCFELYDADVATFKFMEDNAHLFPQADIARVLDACRAALSGPEVRLVPWPPRGTIAFSISDPKGKGKRGGPPTQRRGSRGSRGLRLGRSKLERKASSRSCRRPGSRWSSGCAWRRTRRRARCPCLTWQLPWPRQAASCRRTSW